MCESRVSFLRIAWPKVETSPTCLDFTPGNSEERFCFCLKLLSFKLAKQPPSAAFLLKEKKSGRLPWKPVKNMNWGA